MDKKKIYSIVLFVVLLISSIGMYFSYRSIYHIENEMVENNVFVHPDDVYDLLFSTTYAIDSIIDEDSMRLEDKYLKIEENVLMEDSYASDIQKFKTTFGIWKNRLRENKNLKYYAFDSKGNIYSNDDALNPSTFTKEHLENYRFLLQMQFDKKGNVEFSMPYEIGDESWNQRVLNTFNSNDYSLYATDCYDLNYAGDEGYYMSNVTYNPPKDLTIVYAIPKVLLQGGDEISYWYGFNNMNNYYSYLIPYTCIGLIFVMLVMLFLPIKTVKEIPLFEQCNKIKFEFWVVLYVCAIMLYAISAPELYYMTTYNILYEMMIGIGMDFISDLLVYGLNILYYMFIFAIGMHMMYELKYVFSKGIISFMKEDTFVGSIWKFIKKMSLKLKKWIMNFDLQDPTTIVLLKVLSINFLVLVLIAIMYLFGIGMAILYSIFLFVFIRKQINEIKADYSILLYGAKQLSLGNFNVEIDHDVRLFNSLKNEFLNIKSGFKKAVDEEVKSQKMKTELISNVSHDLKTPLTSIITYVDLLKQDSVSEEYRKQYIDTLDRNAQRLKNLIEDLFEVSKVNSGNVQLDLVDVDIVSLLQQAHFECKEYLDKKNLQIRIQSDEKIICMLDSLKTYRIFENLYMNIAKYALENTRVYIDVIHREEDVCIVFKNISENEINFNPDEISERFVRGDTSRNSEGSGLGLAIAKSFTQLQNGKFFIEVDGDLFKVSVTFPKKKG